MVLPVSFFERADNAFFNAVAVVDADGSVLGVYRKTHIPQAPGYHEKYYFSPGDTGPTVWKTRFGLLGVGICWDQWFPESARCMALMGAEVLLYPTAIGSDPPATDGRLSRRLAAGAAGPRRGRLHAPGGVEPDRHRERRRREHPFLRVLVHRRPYGRLVAQASEDTEEVVTATFDLDAVRSYRERWSVFRDRRPELYGTLLTLDGTGSAGIEDLSSHPAACCSSGRRLRKTRVSRDMTTSRMTTPPRPNASQPQLTRGAFSAGAGLAVAAAEVAAAATPATASRTSPTTTTIDAVTSRPASRVRTLILFPFVRMDHVARQVVADNRNGPGRRQAVAADARLLLRRFDVKPKVSLWNLLYD